MKALMTVLICIVLFPAVISNPERHDFATVSADTVTLAQVRRGSEIGGLDDLGDSRDLLFVERPRRQTSAR
jgi:hypothetical protein